MKNKGFTLVELLGVIIILTLIVVLVFPIITGYVKNSFSKTDKVTIQMIYDASNIYVSNHESNYKKINGNKYIITLNDLVEDGLLSSPINLSDTDVTNSKCVQVTFQRKFEYELKDIGECEEYDSNE